jgi:hypothetical protein
MTACLRHLTSLGQHSTRVIADHGLTDDTARRKLADAVLLFVEDNRSAAEIAEAALEKLGV